MVSKTRVASVALVVGLLVGSGAVYFATQSQVSSLRSSLSSATKSNLILHNQIQNSTLVVALSPQTGQMIHSGWLIIAPVGSGDYAVSLHADGLEGPSSGNYLVEGVTRGGNMTMVPIGGSATDSEFEASAGGTGYYWTVLMENPRTAFEAIDLVYLPGMSMAHAQLVASALLG